jgi:hypothetical protein
VASLFGQAGGRRVEGHAGEEVAADGAAGVRIWTEGDLRLLPDGVEGFEILGVVVLLREQRLGLRRLRGRRGEGRERREDGGVGRLAALQALREGRDDVAGIGEDRPSLGRLLRREELEQDRQVVGSSGPTRSKPPAR